MPLPQWKLLLVFANAARKHGNKVMHINNIDLLTKDLGKALKEQRIILEDPDAGTLETMYELISTIAEVKVLMMAVSKKLGIDTSGKTPATILQDIITTTEARNSAAAQDIKDTLDWTIKFFARDDVKALLEEDNIQIERPKNIKGVGKMFKQITGKVSQESKRLHGFLKIAKKKDSKKNNLGKTPKTDTPSDKKPGQG
jgi:hypothetical protein